MWDCIQENYDREYTAGADAFQRQVLTLVDWFRVYSHSIKVGPNFLIRGDRRIVGVMGFLPCNDARLVPGELTQLSTGENRVERETAAARRHEINATELDRKIKGLKNNWNCRLTVSETL